jgi:aminoglycoside phosphotransferase (APT) family kinase protein
MSSVREGRAPLRSEAESVPQDWEALARYLARFDTAFGPALPQQFAGGFGNLNYLVEIGGKPAVLRRPPAGPLPRGANDMAREYRILSSLWRTYPLAPRALFYCAEPEVLGAPFLIIEYRPGIIVRDILPPSLAGRPEVGAALSRRLVESLVALHAVDPAGIELQTLGRPAGFLTRTLEGWVARANAVADLINPTAFRETVTRLRHRVPPDTAPSLLHSDFKLDNVIIEPETLAPVAVIDWDMGTRGDPLWDLAVLLSYWVERDDPDCMQRLRQMPTAQPGFLCRREVLALYQRLSGRVVDDFSFYRVLAVFRSAVVFLQLFDRYRRDPARNPDCSEFGSLGRELLEYSFEIASGRIA